MKHLNQLALLDHLRPPAGWRTDHAVLSTYSAHTSVLAAALLALAGQDDESGSGTRLGLVRSLRQLRGKAHFILQSGRLTMPDKPASIVSLLDRFIVQVPWDEGARTLDNGQSWHAKFALVRQVPVTDETSGERWIFILGSRNLTMDTSWDMGLVLKAGHGLSEHGKDRYQVIDGIGTIASELSKRFQSELKHWAGFSSALKKAHWHVPEGLSVKEIRLMWPEEERQLPHPPSSKLQELLAVSPFLDGQAVTDISKWAQGSMKTKLLSTRPELERLSIQKRRPLNGFVELLVLPETVISDTHETEMMGEEEVAVQQTGLHAKFIYVKHEKGHSLWLGSPNLTQRAWTRNAECYALIEVHQERAEAAVALLEGLKAFIDIASPVIPADLKPSDKEVTAKEKLAEARNQVAARMATAVQRPSGKNGASINCGAPPHPDDDEIRLSCGPLMNDPVSWPTNKSGLLMPEAGEESTASECLRIRLSLDEHRLEWLQIVPWDPKLPISRDEAILSDYLGPRQMLSWIHEVLSGYANGDDGGPWNGPTRKHAPSSSSAPVIGLPSIEQAMRMWLKDKSRLDEVDRILDMWAHRKPSEEKSSDLEQHIKIFTKTWKTFRHGLTNYSNRAIT